jgi:phage-related protein
MSSQKRRLMPHIAYTCEIGHNPHVKPVIWMGGSREDVRRFPETVQDSLGFDLYRVQCGLEPKDWISLHGPKGYM